MGTPRKLSAVILDNDVSGIYSQEKRFFLLNVSEPAQEKEYQLNLKSLDPEIENIFRDHPFENYHYLDSQIESYCNEKCQGSNSNYLFNLYLLQLLNNIISNLEVK